jgi:hypothetical protein
MPTTPRSPSARDVAPFVSLARRIECRVSERKRIARAFVLIYDEGHCASD